MDILSNDPSTATPNDDNRFREELVRVVLADLSPEQQRDVAALIHAFASGSLTTEAFDQAMTAGGVPAVRQLLA